MFPPSTPSICSPLILSVDVIYKIANSDTASKLADLDSHLIDSLMIQFYKPWVLAFFFPKFWCKHHAPTMPIPSNTSTRTVSSSSTFCDRPMGRRKEKAKKQQARKGVYRARIRTTEGPYVVTEVIWPDAYQLKDDNDNVLTNTWNSEQLRRFFP